MAIDKVTSAAITDSAVTSAKVADGVLQPNFRNIIINGDMSIAQRATSKSSIGFEYGTVDRFQTVQGSLGAFTQSQSTDVPTGQGFAKSLKMDCTTADASPSSGDELYFRQQIEGQNLQYLKKGTSSAESLTVSFWVKSNKTGTYIVELFDHDNSRHINKSYTISSASTWEKKTITYDGDTTGAFNNDNGSSLSLSFMLGAGSNSTSGTLQTSWGSYTQANRQVGQVNLADSTSNEWYITGVQLEVGSAASDFEFLPVDVNLQRCQRYYHQIYSQSGTQAFSDTLDLANCTNYDAGQLFCMKDLPTTMRAIPSIVQTTGTDYLNALRNGAQDGFNGFNGTGKAGYNNIAIFTSGGEGYSGVAGVSVRVRCNASYKLAANAEL